MNISRLLLLPVLAASASAATVTYNDTITAIFGTGNPNTGWVSSTDNNIELALRGKDRTTGATPNDGAGTYSFATGFAPASTRALWNFEFSLNSNASGAALGASLAAYRFVLSYDVDPSLATDWHTVNPLLLDNAYGTNSTPNGGGTVPLTPADAALLIATTNVAQNSGNITFTGTYPGFPAPTVDGTYDFKLTAFSSTDIDGVRPLDSVGMRVVVGAGGSPVPDSGSTLTLLGSALVGMAGLNKLKTRRQAK